MRNNRLRTLAAGCLALILILSSVRLLLPVRAADAISDAAAEILDAQCGGQRVQAWLDGVLTESAGTGSAEWYVMALSAADRQHLDYGSYRRALEQKLDSGSYFSATAKQRCALALIAASGGDIPARCETLLKESLGRQGLMSQVFGLHLINQGVPSETDSAAVISELLSAQRADGGWTLTGDFSDPDVTAMTVQALAPYRQQKTVGNAVSRAVSWLSGKQLPSGGFSSYGKENPESAAQVWIALAALDISALTDARFVKDGHTLLDAIRQFSRGSGQYAHLADGPVNPGATQQVFLALTAEQCRQAGRYFYLPHGLRAKTESAVSVQTSASQTRRSPHPGPRCSPARRRSSRHHPVPPGRWILSLNPCRPLRRTAPPLKQMPVPPALRRKRLPARLLLSRSRRRRAAGHIPAPPPHKLPRRENTPAPAFRTAFRRRRASL